MKRLLPMLLLLASGYAHAITIVQSNVAQFPAYGAGDAASPTLSGVAAGNALVVMTINEMFSTSTLTGNHISVAGGGTWGDLYQTTPFNAATNFYQQIDFEIAYNVTAGAHGPTVTNSIGSGNVAGYTVLMEISGLPTSAALDVTVSSTGLTASSGTAVVSTGTSASIAQTAEIAIAAFIGHSDATNTWTGPSGYTNLYAATNGATQFQIGSFDYKTPLSSGTQSASWSSSTGSMLDMGYQGALITLKAASGGSFTHAGYQVSGNGALVLPTGSSGGFLGCGSSAGHLVTPDGSSVTYYQPGNSGACGTN